MTALLWIVAILMIVTGMLGLVLPALLGAVIGLFFGLPGLLLGPFVGALLGELSARWDLLAAGRAGWGAVIGLVLGTAAKLALGFAMLGLFLVVRFAG